MTSFQIRKQNTLHAGTFPLGLLTANMLALDSEVVYSLFLSNKTDNVKRPNTGNNEKYLKETVSYFESPIFRSSCLQTFKPIQILPFDQSYMPLLKDMMNLLFTWHYKL